MYHFNFPELPRVGQRVVPTLAGSSGTVSMNNQVTTPRGTWFGIAYFVFSFVLASSRRTNCDPSLL